MKANFVLVTLFAALVAFPVAAQYVGPGQGPTNVKELLAIGQDGLHAWCHRDHWGGQLLQHAR